MADDWLMWLILVFYLVVHVFYLVVEDYQDQPVANYHHILPNLQLVPPSRHSSNVYLRIAFPQMGPNADTTKCSFLPR